MAVFRLANPLKHYAWGSPDFIPRLLGRSSDPAQPVAEMWMGAHPLASSTLVSKGRQISLHDYLERHSRSALGQAAPHSGLPFLLKVLAAARPLSIQAHPSEAQARLGFERENSLGIPLDAPQRNYKDPRPKPELICALTPFTALCGFRPYAEVVENFRLLGLESFFPGFPALARHQEQRSFQTFFLGLLTLPEAGKEAVLARLNSALDAEESWPEGTHSIVSHLTKYHPNDLGVLAPLYLNIFVLRPGEALYLGAGVLHAYLDGAGIELMGNSDNVLRGGLSPKHIDREELARILDFTPYTGSRILPLEDSPGFHSYPCPAKEFSLSRLDLGSGQSIRLERTGMPRILFCQEGSALLSSDGEETRMVHGEAVFIGADTPDVGLKGEGRLWLATVPQA